MKPPPSAVDFVNKNSLLQKYCTQEQKAVLKKNAVCCNYRKGDMIFHEHHPAFSIYFVISGKVELWKEAIYTQKQVIRFAGEGDLIGYRGAIMKNADYQLSATALEESLVCSVEKNIFSKILKENSELNLAILMTYINELEKVESRLRNLVNMNVREKVAEALLILQDALIKKDTKAIANSADINSDGSIIPVSRQTIADVAGTCLGRVVKQIAEFRSEKIITGRGKKISLLKPEKLKEMVSRFHQ
jgi:CRP/FNR family transcriptional regulator